jgi:hypothetical protein
MIGQEIEILDFGLRILDSNAKSKIRNPESEMNHVPPLC